MAEGRPASWATRRSQVEELVLRHEREGIPYKRLASESGLPITTLYSWNRRLRLEKRGLGRQGELLAERKGFVEVKSAAAVPKVPNDGGIELLLASGLRIRVERDFEEATLKRLLLALGV
jgi:hypothetical protein